MLIVSIDTGALGARHPRAVLPVDVKGEDVVEAVLYPLVVLLGGKDVLEGDAVAYGLEVELEYGSMAGAGPRQHIESLIAR